MCESVSGVNRKKLTEVKSREALKAREEKGEAVAGREPREEKRRLVVVREEREKRSVREDHGSIIHMPSTHIDNSVDI